jgi:hypothetical protein
MRKIVKEPFAPKRRHINKVESRIGWWRALFAVVSLIFLVLVEDDWRETLAVTILFPLC